MACPRRLLTGYAASVGFIAGFAVAAIAAQSLERAVPDFQLNLYRYIMSFVTGCLLCYVKGVRLSVPEHLRVKTIAMAMSSLWYAVLFYAGVSILPLVDATSLYVSFAMIVTGLLMRLLENQRSSLVQHAAMGGCLVGAVLLLQPWMTFTDGFTPTFIRSEAAHNAFSNAMATNASNSSQLLLEPAASPTTADYVNVIVVVGFILVTLAGGAEAYQAYLAGLPLRSLHPFLQCVCVSGACIPFSFIMCLYFEQPVLTHSWSQVMLIVLQGTGACLCMVSFNVAAQTIGPTQLAIAGNLNLVTLLVYQYVFVKEGLTGRKNPVEIIGCVVITGSVSFSGLFNKNAHTEIE